MAITQEDIDRISKAIADNNYKQDPDIAQLISLGITVRSTDEEQTYRTNLETQLRDKIRGEEDLPAYQNIEKSLAEYAGVEKKDGEKASDFLKRVVTSLKSDVESTKSELEGLKKDGVKDDDPRVKTLQAELERQKAEYDQKLQESSSKLTEFRLQSEESLIRKAVESLPLNVPDEVKNDVIEARINRFKNDYEIRFNEKGERELYNKKEDRVEMNATDLTHKDPSDVAASYFADIKAKDGQTGGTGLAPDNKNTTTGTKSDYSKAKSREELHEMLSRDGLASDSKEFIETWQGTINSYKETTGQPLPIRAE